MSKETSKPLIKMLLSKKISGKTNTRKNFKAALGILFVSLLPYLHNIVSYSNGEPKSWLPNLGIIEAITSADGKVLGFSTYGVFIYMASISFSYLFAWFCALHFAQNRPYRFVLYFPVALSAYQFLIVIFNLRHTQLNELSSKLIVFIIVALLCIFNYFLKKKNERNT